MANIIIIHGLGGSPQEIWFPWLKEELERLGHTVFVPEFPNPKLPQLNEWLAHLNNFEIDQNTIFIGHSLAVPLTLHFLEKHKLKAAFFVGGFCNLLSGGLDKYIRSFIKPFDWQTIKQNCSQFYVFNSDNDSYVPLSKGKELAENLGVKLNMVKGAGHFNEEKKFELLLEKVKKEIN
jgi:uncharacterized protein